MKSTANIIEEYLQRPIVESEITDLTFSMVRQMMQLYAQEAIKEDRINVAENIKFQYGKMDVEGIGHNEIVDVDYESIINCKNIELK